MKSEQIISKKIILELTTEEAEWLHEIMRNPIFDPANEDPVDACMREAFFNATNTA